MVRRLARLAHLAAPAATAAFALAAAGWAATGGAPIVPGPPERTAFAVTAQATGPLIANDLEGTAVLTADAMAPGATVAGEVTVSNAGDAPGVFTLASDGAGDGPGLGGGLSGVLDLTIRDVSGDEPRVLFTGAMRAFDRVGLGTLAAGDARRYRFEVTYPAGRPDAEDDVQQGASTSVGFSWDTVATPGSADQTPTPAPDTTTPTTPTTPAPAPGAPAGPPASGGGNRGGGVTPAPTPPATGSAATVPGGAAVPAIPGAGAARLTVRLGLARRPIARKRLVTWMTTSAPTRARVTGTVTVSGSRKRLKLRATTVKLIAKRRTVRLRLPAAAVRPGARRRLTVRLVVTATASGRTVTMRRTLRVRTPRTATR